MHLRAWEGSGLSECDTDKLLVAAFARGERDAFEQVVRLYQPRVARLAWRLLGWTGEVEDVVQDVFLAAFEKRHKFRGDNGLWPWLTAITVNKCRSRLRRRFLHFRWLRQQSPQRGTNEPADEATLGDETSAKVRSAVRALPSRDREVIVLYYLEDRSASEIGRMLNKSENAIDVRLHRARKRLKELLSDFVID